MSSTAYKLLQNEVHYPVTLYLDSLDNHTDNKLSVDKKLLAKVTVRVRFRIRVRVRVRA